MEAVGGGEERRARRIDRSEWDDSWAASEAVQGGDFAVQCGRVERRAESVCSRGAEADRAGVRRRQRLLPLSR